MMLLSIIVFSYETIIYIIAYVLNQTHKLTAGISWFIVVSFVAATILSIISLVGNVKQIKGYNKGKAITGTVFSGISLFIGGIFLIVFLVVLIATLS